MSVQDINRTVNLSRRDSSVGYMLVQMIHYMAEEFSAVHIAKDSST